jgi:hypothetical protein
VYSLWSSSLCSLLQLSAISSLLCPNMEVQLHAFLTLVLDGGEWTVSRRGRFTPRAKSPRYPLDRRLGGPHSLSGCGGEEKNPCFCRESNSSRLHS